MFRILRFTRPGLFFFKRIKIGLMLVRSSVKTITFEHGKYFIFCLIIALVQLLRIILIGSLDPKISRSILLTEFLSGQSFFEILLDYLQLPITFHDLKMIIIKNVIFFIELTILYFTNITLALYVHRKNSSIIVCFQKALEKTKIILLWIILEMIILLLTASLGAIGNIVLFIWQLITVLNIQILAFEKKNIFEVIKHSFDYFKKMFGNILGIDLLIDLILVVLTGFFYYVYKTGIAPTLSFLNIQSDIHYIIVPLIFYIFATINALEVITFTKLYDIFHHHPENLKK